MRTTTPGMSLLATRFTRFIIDCYSLFGSVPFFPVTSASDEVAVITKADALLLFLVQFSS